MSSDHILGLIVYAYNDVKGPHSEPTGEVMVNQPQIDPAATKAAFAMYEEPDAKGTHPDTKP